MANILKSVMVFDKANFQWRATGSTIWKAGVPNEANAHAGFRGAESIEIRFLGGANKVKFNIWEDDARSDSDELDEFTIRGNNSRQQEIAETVTLNGKTFHPRDTETSYGPQLQADYVLTSPDFVRASADGQPNDYAVTSGYALIAVHIDRGPVNNNPMSASIDGIIFSGDVSPVRDAIYTFTTGDRHTIYPIDYSSIVTCFTDGTLIETLHGSVAVERLRRGDAIRTLDHGYQPIRWIGSTTVDQARLLENQKLRPIRIRAGALGPGLPTRDLVVSRQHRIFVRSKIAQRMFQTQEILLPAIKLIELDGVDIDENVSAVTYWHILFDKHEVVFSEGTPSESLFTGPCALASLSPTAREEIGALFPALSGPDSAGPLPARYIPPRGAAVRQLVARHIKHKKPMLEILPERCQ